MVSCKAGEFVGGWEVVGLMSLVIDFFVLVFLFFLRLFDSKELLGVFGLFFFFYLGLAEVK